jgi:hypothetical protein
MPLPLALTTPPKHSQNFPGPYAEEESGKEEREDSVSE